MDLVSAPADFWEVAVRMLLAAALGGAVGVDREMQQKPAGFRTHALVGLGACLTSIVSVMMVFGGPDDASAPGRVIQGIVAGVGFIGGGAILRSHDSKDVYGLTTAASIWVVAAVGIAVGTGLWRTAIAAVTLALLTLVVGDRVDRFLRGLRDRK